MNKPNCLITRLQARRLSCLRAPCQQITRVRGSPRAAGGVVLGGCGSLGGVWGGRSGGLSPGKVCCAPRGRNALLRGRGALPSRGAASVPPSPAVGRGVRDTDSHAGSTPHSTPSISTAELRLPSPRAGLDGAGFGDGRRGW